MPDVAMLTAEQRSTEDSQADDAGPHRTGPLGQLVEEMILIAVSHPEVVIGNAGEHEVIRERYQRLKAELSSRELEYCEAAH